eukprot:g2039.t1
MRLRVYENGNHFHDGSAGHLVLIDDDEKWIDMKKRFLRICHPNSFRDSSTDLTKATALCKVYLLPGGEEVIGKQYLQNDDKLVICQKNETLKTQMVSADRKATSSSDDLSVPKRFPQVAGTPGNEFLRSGSMLSMNHQSMKLNKSLERHGSGWFQRREMNSGLFDKSLGKPLKRVNTKSTTSTAQSESMQSILNIPGTGAGSPDTVQSLSPLQGLQTIVSRRDLERDEEKRNEEEKNSRLFSFGFGGDTKVINFRPAAKSESTQSVASVSDGDSSRSKKSRSSRTSRTSRTSINMLNRAKENFERLRARVRGSTSLRTHDDDTVDDYINEFCNIYNYDQVRKDVVHDEVVLKWIFMPDTQERLAWDLFIIALAIFYVLIVPLRVFFDLPITSGENIFDKFADFLFIFDIWLNFHTAFHERGKLITDINLIRFDYATSYFVPDLLASIPFDWFIVETDSGASKAGKLFRMYKLFKLFRMFRLGRYMRRIEIALRFNPSMVRFLKSFTIMFFMWHFTASFYWGIAVGEFGGYANCTLTPNSSCCLRRPDVPVCFVNECIWYTGCRDPNISNGSIYTSHYTGAVTDASFSNIDYWVPHPDTANLAIESQYLHSFFWALEVTTGIGDDISPKTDTELLFTSISTVIGLIMYSVIIGSASSALQNMDSASKERREFMDRLNDSLRYNKVPPFFQKIIVEYFDHKWDNPTHYENTFLELPRTLRLRLSLVLNKHLINDIPIFNELSARSFIRLIQRLQHVTFLPGEYIIHQSEEGDEMFFIKTGKVDVLYKDTDKILTTLKDGAFFGQECLLSNAKRYSSHRAVNYADLMVLERPDFEIICSDSLDFRMALIKENKEQRRHLDGLCHEEEIAEMKPIRKTSLITPVWKKVRRMTVGVFDRSALAGIAPAITGSISSIRNSKKGFSLNGENQSMREKPRSDNDAENPAVFGKQRRRKSLNHIDKLLLDEDNRNQRRASIGSVDLNTLKHINSSDLEP